MHTSRQFAPRFVAVSAAAVALLAGSAHAQWTAINLEPTLPGLATSQAYGVHAGQQVGIVVLNGETRAALWSGTPGSFVDLAPMNVPDLFASAALGVNNGTQVGYIAVVDKKGDDFSYAAMWSGSAASYVNLHPDGFEQSRALCAQGNLQGGWVTVNGVGNAALWTGTAASYVSLHPAGTSQSFIQAIDGETQAGYASVGFSRASLWRGTPESWVNMHPVQVPEISVSAALSAHGGQQAGWAIYGPASGGISHPALWTGTAESYVDLLPAGWQSGQAIGCFDGRQVGNARMAGSDIRAMVWSGTAESFVNLHDFLPPGYLRSNAQGIWNDGVNWYVAGIAVTPSFTSDAFLWVSPMDAGCPADLSGSSDPKDPGYGIPDGTLDAADFFYFLDQFTFANLAVADLTGSSDPNDPAYGVPDGNLDAADFFYYLDIFVAGCP